MEPDQRRIKKCLKEAHQLQQKHLDDFETSVLPDLEQQRMERKLAFNLSRNFLQEA